MAKHVLGACIDQATFKALKAGDRIEIDWNGAIDGAEVVKLNTRRDQVLVDLDGGGRTYFSHATVRAVLSKRENAA